MTTTTGHEDLFVFFPLNFWESFDKLDKEKNKKIKEKNLEKSFLLSYIHETIANID